MAIVTLNAAMTSTKHTLVSNQSSASKPASSSSASVDKIVGELIPCTGPASTVVEKLDEKLISRTDILAEVVTKLREVSSAAWHSRTDAHCMYI